MGVSFVIDLGEMEEFLMTMHGVAEGFAGMKSVEDSAGLVRSGLLRDFGIQADNEASKRGSRIAHMYEWGDPKDRSVVDATPGGRLWVIEVLGGTASHTTARMKFLQSNEMVPLEGPTDVPRARHIWWDKAEEQEFDTFWQFSAGGEAKTRVTPGVSQYLYITHMSGEPMFRKKWITYSEYTGEFRDFFNKYWAFAGTEALESELNHKLDQQFKPEVEKLMNDRLKAARRMPTRMDPTPNPVKVSVRGKPMAPGGLRTTPPREVVRRTRSALKKVMRR